MKLSLNQLVGTMGHVAFVMHTAVIANTDGRNVDQWARPLRAIDFELLCKNGTRKPIEAYKSCHMLKVPARLVMTSSLCLSLPHCHPLLFSFSSLTRFR